MTNVALLPHRAVIAVTGADARSFLNGLLTNSVDAVAPGRAVWAGLLSAQGKALFDMLLFDDGAGGIWLDVEAGRAAELLKRLSLYKLRAQVSLALREDLAVAATWGGPAPSAAASATDPRLPALGHRLIGAGFTPTTTADAYQAHRLANGVGEGSSDFGVDQLLWLETNADALNGVDFAKGCYVGQENTARMHYRNKVRKRFLPVRCAHGWPEGETSIRSGDAAAGDLKSICGELGLALMRVDFIDKPLTIGGQAVEVFWPEFLLEKIGPPNATEILDS
jgi:folate-binding protein YgfZ